MINPRINRKKLKNKIIVAGIVLIMVE